MLCALSQMFGQTAMLDLDGDSQRLLYAHLSTIRDSSYRPDAVSNFVAVGQGVTLNESWCRGPDSFKPLTHAEQAAIQEYLYIALADVRVVGSSVHARTRGKSRRWGQLASSNLDFASNEI